MNECLVITATVLFALSGAYSFLIENFFPMNRIKTSYARKMSPGQAIQKAEQVKQRARSVFFVIWGAGFVLIILGLVGYGLPK